MKRVLRGLGLGVLGLLGIVLAVAGYVRLALPSLPGPESLKVAATPEQLARGAYLSEHVAVCTGCHSERDFSKFGAPLKPGSHGQGGEVFGHREGFPGEIVAPNITPFALGKWSDGQLLQALTEGVTPASRALFPVMSYPAYAKLCRADLEAIIAYTRTLAPIENVPAATKLDFPVSLIVRTMPSRATRVDVCPDPKNTVAYGKYLVETAVCTECHTQRSGPKKNLELEFAGGSEFTLPSGFKVRSKNITPDASGIGSWSREAFIHRFAAYRDPASAYPTPDNAENSLMPWSMYAGMTDQDLGAIYDFLRTVKPVKL